MGAPDILQHLVDSGLRVTSDGGQLLVSPRDLITHELRQFIREWKPELLSELAAQKPLAASTAIHRARLVARGLSDDQADELAERLVRRDLEYDDRTLCAECIHFRRGAKTCGNNRQAEMPRELGELAEMFQRCAGFSSSL